MAAFRTLPACLLFLVFLIGTLAVADDLKPEGGRVADGLVTLLGMVRTADGAPAVGATVKTFDVLDEPRVVTRTDAEGRFRLRGVFGLGSHLCSSTADGKQQATRLVPANALSAGSAGPVELKLSPSVAQEVIVTSEGKPAAGVRVAVVGKMASASLGVTGPDGTARVLMPADVPPILGLAWHPELGIGRLTRPIAGGPLTIELQPPSPLKIRVVDPDGKPVAGVKLAPGFSVKGAAWMNRGWFPDAVMTTDAEGSITIPWAPRDNPAPIDGVIHNPAWMVESRFGSQPVGRVATLKARRRVAVEGSLAMPAGENPEGLLIAGISMGPDATLDRSHARVRADGTFTLRACAEHTYGLVVVDLHWASEVWTGKIVESVGANAATITIPVEPAAPLTVVVTQGEARAPLPDAYVTLGTFASLPALDRNRNPRMTEVAINSVLKTDRDGEAKAGLGRGKHYLKVLSFGGDREFEVTSDKPVIQGFHRD